MINLDYSSSLASRSVFWYMLWIYFSKKMGKIRGFYRKWVYTVAVYTILIFLKIANVKICKLLRIMSLFSLLSDIVTQIFTYASVDLLNNTWNHISFIIITHNFSYCPPHHTHTHFMNTPSTQNTGDLVLPPEVK